MPQVLADFLKVPIICMLWKCNFDLSNWISSLRSSFLARAEFEDSPLRPGFLGLEDRVSSCCILRIHCWGFIRCFASISCRGMKHNSDSILDSSGCQDNSNLVEDLSSHPRGSLTQDSLVPVSLLPTPLSE